MTGAAEETGAEGVEGGGCVCIEGAGVCPISGGGAWYAGGCILDEGTPLVGG